MTDTNGMPRAVDIEIYEDPPIKPDVADRCPARPVLILPDLSEAPGEWSPFEPDGTLDVDRLRAEGWTFVGEWT